MEREENRSVTLVLDHLKNEKVKFVRGGGGSKQVLFLVNFLRPLMPISLGDENGNELEKEEKHVC